MGSKLLETEQHIVLQTSPKMSGMKLKYNGFFEFLPLAHFSLASLHP